MKFLDSHYTDDDIRIFSNARWAGIFDASIEVSWWLRACDTIAEPLVRTSREDIERVVVSFATMISVIEYGALERALVTSPDLAKRFQAVRDTALVKLKGTRAILVAALENDDGAKRNETPEQRLQRSIETAKTEAPLDIGSFASYAELPDDPDDQR